VDRRAEVHAGWKAGLTRLAACHNVVVKLGGLATAFCAPPDWSGSERTLSERMAASTRDQYLHVIDAFTPARCMLESNFPVEKSATSYRALWNSYKRITAGFSAHERQQLFRGTAARTYSLEPPLPLSSIEH
jgi:predicted TIM-barrel fold metal-dependent hydrolase